MMDTAQYRHSEAVDTRDSRDCDVSVVMPALNEENTVGVCVTKALSGLQRSGRSGEVVVVDNGSTDRTAELAAQAGARVVHESSRGYGNALLRGMSEARGRYIIMGDSDNTYDFSDLESLLTPLLNGYDFVIGNRYAGGIMPGAMTWSHRYMGTPLITFLLRIFAGVKVGDSQCGLRALTRGAAERLRLRSGGMELASEMLLKAARQKLRIAEVPIPYYPREGETKLKTFRDGWRHLRFLLLATPNYLFTIPGAILTLVGILTLALALPSSSGIDIGPLQWQPVFAGTIFLVVGVNALLLGLVSRLYTVSKGITAEDALVRFYRQHVSLETVLLAAAILVLLGLGTDLALLFGGIAEGDAIPNQLNIAAVAQSLIIIGGNLALVGALASLLDVE